MYIMYVEIKSIYISNCIIITHPGIQTNRCSVPRLIVHFAPLFHCSTVPVPRCRFLSDCCCFVLLSSFVVMRCGLRNRPAAPYVKIVKSIGYCKPTGNRWKPINQRLVFLRPATKAARFRHDAPNGWQSKVQAKRRGPQKHRFCSPVDLWVPDLSTKDWLLIQKMEFEKDNFRWWSNDVDNYKWGIWIIVRYINQISLENLV